MTWSRFFSRARPTARRAGDGWFRAALLGLAAGLALLGAWLAVPTLLQRADPDRSAAAGTAARLAMVRGDLWADHAAAIAGGMERGSASAETAVADARRAATKAVRFAPHEARAWLVLADTAERVGRDPIGPLRMAFFTDPADPRILATRVGIAVRSPAIADPEIQDLTGRDIRQLAALNDGRAILRQAYQEASPIGKLFMARIAVGIDPAFDRLIRQGY